MPETMETRSNKPLSRASESVGGLCCFLVAAATVLLGLARPVAAGDGASEALELRLHAELAIVQERTSGSRALAETMREMLPGMLLEYLASRDETIALDVVDSAFVREQFEVAKMMEEPGVAWALDVFAGPGTGYEHGLRTQLSGLADFHEERAQRATEAAVRAYERQLDHRLERIDQAQEMHQQAETRQLEAALAKSSDRAEHAQSLVASRNENQPERSERAQEQLADNAERQGAQQVERQAEPQVERQADPVPDRGADRAQDRVADSPRADPGVGGGADPTPGGGSPGGDAGGGDTDKGGKKK